MTDTKTYTGVGTSNLFGVVKFRFANGNVEDRASTLTRLGHTEVNMVALPTPMTKEDAIAFYQAQHPEVENVRKPNQPVEKVKNPTPAKRGRKPKEKVLEVEVAIVNAPSTDETVVESTETQEVTT